MMAMFSLLFKCKPLFYCIFSIITYLPYTLFHLHSPAFPHPAVATLLSVSMSSLSSFSFVTQPLSPTASPELSACSLSMSLSLFCLLVQFVH